MDGNAGSLILQTPMGPYHRTPRSPRPAHCSSHLSSTSGSTTLGIMPFMQQMRAWWHDKGQAAIFAEYLEAGGEPPADSPNFREYVEIVTQLVPKIPPKRPEMHARANSLLARYQMSLGESSEVVKNLERAVESWKEAWRDRQMAFAFRAVPSSRDDVNQWVGPSICGLAASLGMLGGFQIHFGELRASHDHLGESIQLSRRIADDFGEFSGLQYVVYLFGSRGASF